MMFMDLNDILNDNIHGSEFLAHNLIDILMNSVDGNYDFEKLIEKKGMMGEILNIIYLYRYYGKDLLSIFRNRLKISKDLIRMNSENILKNKKIGVISYSSTVFYAILNSKIKYVNVLESNPGGEGKHFFNDIKDKIDANLFRDSDLEELVKDSDILISGLDIFNRRYFANKILTYEFFKTSRNFRKMNIVLTSTLKYFPWNVKLNDLYEWIQWKDIDFLITEKGIFSSSSISIFCRISWPPV